MARAKKEVASSDSQNKQDPECSTGNGDHIEAPEELDAIETELMDPVDVIADDPDSSPGASANFLGADACGSLCTMIFDVMAARRGDHWKLAPAEAEQLGGALDAVLAKYLPDNMERWGPEITLVTVLSMVVMPRMKEPVPDGEA